MRKKLWLLPALGLALLLVLLLLGERTWRWGGGGPRGEEGDETAAHRAASAASAGIVGAATPSDHGTGSDASTPDMVTVDGRVVYLDGTPASGVELHLAVGRPIETRRFRNGEYTDLTVRLVAAHVWTVTQDDGSFTFPPVVEPARCRRFVFTTRESRAFVVEELFGNGQIVVARRRVSVTGRLLGQDGNALADCWFEAQLGKPEDWHTRVLKEEDIFAVATGILEVDTLARNDTRSLADGSFELLLSEGKNTFTFGEAKTDGTLPAEIPPRAVELGDLRVPGPPPRGDEHSLTGVVLNLAGAPHAGCEVRAWDGSVGMHTHETVTDAEGGFAIEGLTGSFVILWAISTERRHVFLPTQTTGSLRPPCARIVLQAPEEEEFAWARVEAEGFYVFLRDGVLLGGDALGPADVVGLPPGPLKIVLLTMDARILEASLLVREAGDLLLGLHRFRDTTWE